MANVHDVAAYVAQNWQDYGNEVAKTAVLLPSMVPRLGRPADVPRQDRGLG